MIKAFTLKLFAALTLSSFTLAAAGSAHAQNLNAIDFSSLPHSTSSSIGRGNEPVDFVYVGSEQQLIQLFVDHGWNGADPISPSTLLQAYQAAQADAPYPTAPISPAFIAGEPQDLSFQISTEANTIRERHHTRIWLTDATTSDGRPIWVGTASFDTSIASIGRTFLPVHHIDPDLPAERDFIISSLGLGGIQYVQFIEAANGINPFGDPYFTDGLAAVIDLDSLTYSVPQNSQAQPASADAPPADQLQTRLRDCFGRAAVFLGAGWQ